jgi:uncharacterized protein (TIGR03000 family)
MIKRWIPAVAALALLLGNAGSGQAARFAPFFFVPFGLGNPVFGYGPGWGGWGGWGYYGGGIPGGYYPRVYGAFPYSGYGYSGFGPGSVAYGGMNSVYSGGFYPPTAPAGISYVAYAGHRSSSTVTLTTTPNLPATVEVELPAGAELWFDGQATTQKGATRTFHTPALEKGLSYHYDVRARWMSGGTAVDQTQRVDVFAGGQVKVVFPKAK